MLAKLDRGTTRIDFVVGRHLCMLDGDGEARLDDGIRALASAVEQISRLIEDPRLAERSASDHDGVATRFAVHAHCVFRRLDVAVADHRNLERLRYRGDLVPVRMAGV